MPTQQELNALTKRVTKLEGAAAARDHVHVGPGRNAEDQEAVTGPVAKPAP